MEEEGEEEETKKRPKTTGNKVKKRKRVTDKKADSLSTDDNKEKSTDVPTTETLVLKVSEEANTEKTNRETSNVSRGNAHEEIADNKVDSITNGSSDIPQDNTEKSEPIQTDSENIKVGKAVSFSPSTEFLGDSSINELSPKPSVRELSDQPKDSLDNTIEEDNQEQNVNKSDNPSSPESGRKHIELTTVFLNSPAQTITIPDAVEEIIDIEGIIIEDEVTITDGENKEVELTITEFEFLNLSRNEFKADERSDSATNNEIQSDENKTEIDQSKVNNEVSEDKDVSVEVSLKVDSPILPPRNGSATSPDPPPKKVKGAPLLSAMKKMVERPMNIIKSKMESKSPSRKEKGVEEPGSPKSKATNIAVKPADVTGSPPLPPRNKPDAGSPKSMRSNEDESQILSSETKVTHFSLRNFFSDDPKKFNSLQPKRNNGPTRVRESSLPPPSKLEDGRKSPKIPPKTYMWEELRRTKMKGGYPWTHLYKGSFDEAKWKEIMEHEYEYVDPRPELLRPEPIRPQTGVRQSPRGSPRVSPRESPEPEKPKVQRRFIRIKDSDQVIIPLHGSSDEEHNPDRYDDPTLIGQEEIGITPPVFLRPTPSPSPSRRKVENEQKLSEKLRNTAGQLGSKIRKISLPDKSKIRLPDKPKFISDIQQMKLPDKPKFLTEKPKFLTEKPKFLTEKPKFLTEKPKFLTEKPKFLTEKPKFLTEKPKFLKEGIKFPDTSKINMPSIKLPKARRFRPKRETKTSAMSEFGSDKNIFQTIKARTYPRFLNKKKRQGIKNATPPPPPGQTRFDSESLPSTPRSKRDDKWLDVYKQKKTVEEGKVPSYVNGESFQERYSKRDAKRASSSSIVDSDREQHSSGSSGQRHRAGVIEEIDSDEFFVRVKGISREDVQVSKYLSTEIREAFRSPKNALASLDKEDFEDEEPVAPHRSKKPKEYPRKDYATFPLRPSRGKKGKSHTMEKPPRRFRKAKPSGSLPSLDRDRDFDMEVEEVLSSNQEPPMAPKRRKSAKDLATDERWTSAIEQTVVPVEVIALESEVKAELELPPIAPVRKARSRGTSLADEDRTSRGAESLRSDMQIEDELNEDFHMEDDNRSKSVKEMGEENQTFALNIPLERSAVDSPTYSNISKSRPPRPPPPDKGKPGKIGTHHRLKSKLMGHRHMQQLQTWKDQGVNFFFTYPRRAMKTISKAPKRPNRNYSTIAGPTRPPRRHKVFREPVYVDADIEPADSIPFMDDDEKLKSSRSEENVGGMKGRPLPPTPQTHSNIDGEDIDVKEAHKTEKLNLLNNFASKEVSDTISVSIMDDVSTKSEDKMQGRPLPPPPRRKRGSSSTERKRDSISEDHLNNLNLREEEAINARMTIDIIEPVPIMSEEKVEHSQSEDKIVVMDQPIKIDSSAKTAEISQQTSFEVAEINVSVQTDPLPEGAIVDETDDIITKPKLNESDEEPTIEKYLEKYGSEVKMLGRHLPSSKSTAAESQPTENVIESVEKEIIPTRANEIEADSNINNSEKKVADKTLPLGGVKEEERKEQTPVPIILPDRLHLSHLDVDELSVSSLKASQIIVSDLTGESIQVTELTSRGGNLVVSGMEFPPSFIQSLASEISAKVEEKLPQKEAEKPQDKQPESISQEESHVLRPESPQRPQRMKVITATAPPTVIIQPTSEASISLSPEAGVLSSSDSIPTPRTTRNRGKKSSDSTRFLDDSEDELASSIKRSSRSSSPSRQVVPSTSSGKSTEQPSHSPDSEKSEKVSASGLTARQLLIELLKIWKNCVVEGFSACSNTVGAMFPEGQKRRDAQRAACILFVIIIGLFALGFGTDNTVHYHHWDYVPPRV